MNGIPDDVRAFVHAHIDSVEQLEVLLLLRRESTRAWTGDEVARELRTNPLSAGSRLVNLKDRNLMVEEDGGRFRYAPSNVDLERAVSGLARAYAEMRVSVIDLIFSKPVDRLGTFADAFKLRGGK